MQKFKDVDICILDEAGMQAEPAAANIIQVSADPTFACPGRCVLAVAHVSRVPPSALLNAPRCTPPAPLRSLTPAFVWLCYAARQRVC